MHLIDSTRHAFGAFELGGLGIEFPTGKPDQDVFMNQRAAEIFGFCRAGGRLNFGEHPGRSST